MNWIYRRLTLPFLFFVYLSLPANSQDNSNLVVIANGKAIPAEMKIEQLKSVMRGEKLRWPDGSKVVIALLKSNTPIGVVTSKKIYNMSPNDLNKYWLALVFQGKAAAPNFFNSESDLEEFVSQTSGAIGIVTQASANNKVIAIDGKKSL
ncbi:hypothetical protein SAMN06265337_0090 [Hymenobacter gelipurpurascens]|uniref:PBP domain-containing protein n=1 Tax=Hymenobacter gelipurpurascens TaxID=89968 RepID=A0A212T0Q2_9BACT|nr:hypothetical protein [Hymenobacter gelipurpurascens]SNC59622.1 hypothetical protein SAMN06265337_0090 [Hymenobacter gelipurpurascens]